MVVVRGADWGRAGSPPSGTPVVRCNEDLAHLLIRNLREFILESGDLALTVGSDSPSADGGHRSLPLDLMGIEISSPRLGSQDILASSHCLIRSPWWRGGLLHGSITVLCNAQFFRGRDIAPRGHPNDGKIEIITFSSELRLRERWKICARLRTGDHLPHPLIDFRQISSATELHLRGVITVDGRKFGRAFLSTITPLPDAAAGWIPVPT
jgi:hypothetical protein